MSVEILTKEDLIRFKIELIAEFERVIAHKIQSPPKWLRSREVEKLLDISPGTLQNYRINGNIKWTKVGSTYYYSLEDMHNSLQTNSSTPIF